jgi:hypothetical protein
VDWKKVNPYELIGRRPDHVGGNLVRFRLAGYDEMVLVSTNRTNMFVGLDINPIFITYQHQPIMRIIDYVMTQIFGLLL